VYLARNSLKLWEFRQVDLALLFEDFFANQCLSLIKLCIRVKNQLRASIPIKVDCPSEQATLNLAEEAVE
jgi:hypothetical protein